MKVILTPWHWRWVASFILNIFVGKHCFTQSLRPFWTLGATPKRICSSLNLIINVTRGAPWTRTNLIWPNASASLWILFVVRLTSQTWGKGGLLCYNFGKIPPTQLTILPKQNQINFLGLGDGVNYTIVQGLLQNVGAIH
jgi:hypothetical protein